MRLARQVRSERVELAVEMESAAGNAIRPWDEQVQGEIERARAPWLVTGAEHMRPPRRAHEVVSGETGTKFRNNDDFGQAVVIVSALATVTPILVDTDALPGARVGRRWRLRQGSNLRPAA